MNIHKKPPEPEKYVVLECINPNVSGIGATKFTREKDYEYPAAMFPEKSAVKIIACERMKANPSFRYGVQLVGEQPAPQQEETHTEPRKRGRRAKR